MKNILFLVAALLSLSASATEVYKIDPVHSSLGFRVRHFVGTVTGTFPDISGMITVDRDALEHSSVLVTVGINRINTGNEKRDTHLRSPDFFDAKNFGEATFHSRQWKRTGESTFDIVGDLTVRGLTQSVTLHATLLGFGPGPQGASLSGWEAHATLLRSDFGILGPSILGNAIGNEVTLDISVEADLQVVPDPKPIAAQSDPKTG